MKTEVRISDLTLDELNNLSSYFDKIGLKKNILNSSTIVIDLPEQMIHGNEYNGVMFGCGNALFRILSDSLTFIKK